MKNIIKSLTLISFPVLLITVSAEATPAIQSEWLGTPIPADESAVNLMIPISNEVETRLVFDFTGVELVSTPGRNGFEVEIPGEGHTSIEGVPSLPKVSRMAAIPARARVRLEYEYGEVDVYENIELLPTMEVPIYDLSPEAELVYDAEIYNADRMFPAELVELGEPAIMRDLRLIRVTVNPVRYNPVTQRLELYHHVEVTLRYEEGGTINTKTADPRKVSRSFAEIYRHRVVNFKHLDLEIDEEWGTLLVIAPNNATVLSQIQPLVNWKNYRGINTVVADLSQTGGSSSQIKSFIQQAYDTWEPQLAYLILIGDTGGSIAVPASNSTGDHDYSRLEGGDILSDIAVGRFSCANNTQLMTEVNKVVMYESSPFMGQTDWYKKGAVVAGSSLSGISTIMTKQGIRYKALKNGYTQVDTLWYNMGGSVPSFTNGCINAGVGFYNYRGWLGMSQYSNWNINQLVNYHKLPFVVTITCGTGDIVGTGSDYSEEFFRVGTPTNPTGAIGAIATATTGTHTRYNNCMDNGIFGAFFDYGIYQFGDAMVVGKFDLYMSYPDNSSNVTSYSNWNNLIGDPSCRLWTDIPQPMTVTHPENVPVGTTSITVSVTDSNTGEPMEGVDICLTTLGILSLFEVSDENGEAIFYFPPDYIQPFYITCTHHNYIPVMNRVEMFDADVYVNYQEISVDDDNSGLSSGNGDGDINPGETIELGISLKNWGDSLQATNIVADLSCESDFVSFSDSTENYPDLDPGELSSLIYGYVFTVSEDAPDGDVDFNLNISADQGEWDSPFLLNLAAPNIIYQTHNILDPDGQLDPGDQSPILVTLMNVGRLTGENIVAVLTCDDDLITILQDESNYGSIYPHLTSTGEPFVVNASSSIIPGSTFHFYLNISGDNGYQGTTGYDLVVGTPEENDPCGPDEYGYYAIDNTDTEYSDRPVYEWVEIDPTYLGPGQVINLTDYSNEQDDTELVPLPFIFRYYGEDFNRISVCSNGWLAFGNMTYFTNFRNWYIPSTLGPYSLVAAFWDDLYLMYSPPGKVYKYYDEANHRFIVEWSRVRNRAPGNPIETFEVILLDPAFHPTPTGDGEIIFQYHTVANVQGLSSDNHYATVGIKSNDNLMGLQYTYWNHYSPGAAELGAGRAIKFTTKAPGYIGPPSIIHQPLPDVTQQTQGYVVDVEVSSYYALDYNNMKIFWNTTGGGSFNQEPLIPISAGVPTLFTGVIPEQNPGTYVFYYLWVRDIEGREVSLPSNAPNTLFSFRIGPQTLIFFDDAEADSGWTLGVPGDNATSGIWVREDPVISITENFHVVQPEDDHTPDPGHICFVTGNADPGAPAGTNDVDGGRTTLLTPVFDLSDVANPIISFWHWYSNDLGNAPGQDYWQIDVTNDNGLIWRVVLHTTESTDEMWEYLEFNLLDYCAANSTVRMRFIASDYLANSLVEACVDDFTIIDLDTVWVDGEGVEFVPPANIYLKSEGDDLILSWIPVQGASAYRIYRGDSPGFHLEQGCFIGRSRDSHFSLKIPQAKGREFYRIRVIR